MLRDSERWSRGRRYLDASPLYSCVRCLSRIQETGGARALCACGVEDHAHVIMLAWKKAAIERDGIVDVLVGEMRPQSIFLLLDLAVAGNLSEAYFEDGFKGL